MALANSPIYSPTPIAVQMQSEDGRFLQKYLQQQLQNISVALQQTTANVFVPISAAPSRPLAGMVVNADGTNWNPGDGSGLYAYVGGSWVPLFVSYSSGTWTPSDQSGAGLVFTSVTVGYSKIGNMVFIYGRLTYPTTASIASAIIGGLPFPIPNSLKAQNPSLGYSSALNSNVYNWTVENSSNFEPLTITGAVYSNAQLSAGQLIFCFNYPVT